MSCCQSNKSLSQNYQTAELHLDNNSKTFLILFFVVSIFHCSNEKKSTRFTGV